MTGRAALTPTHGLAGAFDMIADDTDRIRAALDFAERSQPVDNRNTELIHQVKPPQK